jgi:MFS family permease
MAEQVLAPAHGGKVSARPALVVIGASLGTLFEWYDFFLYGSLAALIAKHFFAGVNEATAFIFALAAFAAGFAVRPLGALLFGRIGDIVGRKRTFLATMAIMGAATFIVGLLPDYGQIGVAAPVALVALRMLQGLAVGGEYGGAAIYVAEHARADRRGLNTSWLNATATMGLVTSLLVIVGVRMALPDEAFQSWGWRLPFLLSAVLLGLSMWIRMRLGESPVFEKMKSEGATSRAPWAEAFGRWSNLKLVLLAFVAVCGMTSIWYAAQFYVLFFIERVLGLPGIQADLLMAAALTITAASYPVMGWLSDRIGRKPLLVASCALGAIFMFPAFHLITKAANPALAAAQASAPVMVRADPSACSVQFDPVGANKFDGSGCDIAKAFLAKAGVSYRSVALAAGAPAEIHVGGAAIVPPDPRGLAPAERAKAIAAFQASARAALTAAGYPKGADPDRVDAALLIGVAAFLGILGAMNYAPGAAFLVELFPARIRYTSLSVPYHLGSGWVGGFLPATAFAIVAATGDTYSGLWYPVGFASMGFVISLLFLPETRGRSIS